MLASGLNTATAAPAFAYILRAQLRDGSQGETCLSVEQSPNIAPGNPVLPIQLSLIAWGIPKAERSEIVLCGHFNECLDKEMGSDDSGWASGHSPRNPCS